MNAAVKTLRPGVWSGGQVWDFSVVRHYLVSIILSACVLVSSLAVISVTNDTRAYCASLASAQHVKENLQVEWGKLLLERGAWTSQVRVESVATHNLAMRSPKVKRMIVVK